MSGSLWDEIRSAFDPNYAAAQDIATQRLSDMAAAQAVQLHQILLKLQAAQASGNAYQAEQYRIAYNTAVDAYNGLVTTLHQQEGPSSTALFLAKLPDAAGQVLMDAVNKLLDQTKKAAKGLALYLLLPLAILGLALVWVAGKSGAVRVSRVV